MNRNLLSALLFCVLCFLASATSSWGLDSQLGWGWARQMSMVIEKNPRYTWGGTSVQGGMDCTGYIGITAKWAGMPVKRSTTIRMVAGLDGWISNPVPLHAVAQLDLVFFSIKRRNQHVGAVWDLDPKRTFTHASSSRGVIISPLESGYWADKRSEARHLTIGD